MLHTVWHGYLAVSIILTVVIFLWLMGQDLIDRFFYGRPRDFKFGYNCTSQLAWIILIAMLPVVNLFAILFILFNWIMELVEYLQNLNKE